VSSRVGAVIRPSDAPVGAVPVGAVPVGVVPVPAAAEPAVGWLGEQVQVRLSRFLTTKSRQLLAIAGDLQDPMLALTDLLAGGKRLRPAFLYWGWRAAPGADPGETGRIVDAAAALELLQASALIHDDVMDGSETRRGLPAIHRRFAGLHRGAGWTGSPESFGTSAAILLGDLCLSWSDEMLRRCEIPAERLLTAMRVFDDMRTEVIAGQYLDVVEQAVGGASVTRALRVVRYKSAKYTIERPLHIGAVLAGGGGELLRRFSGYGLPLGEAFQLRDDVLGVFGDPAATGKPAGDDLRDGKRTVLIAEAGARASTAQRAVLRRYLGDPALGASGVAALREVIVETGALAVVEDLVRDLTDRSLRALDCAPIADPVAADALRTLADAVTRRSA